MAVRTIDAPGIEMHEIDKSQYSPAMTGTKVLVTGFANSGEDYTPMIFTSKAAWLNYYGEPDNEAERYFYNASMEVLNQNGVVNCCKLPYENEARDKFVGMKYKLDTSVLKEINTVFTFLEANQETKEIISKSDLYKKDYLRFFLEKYNVTDPFDKNKIVEELAKKTGLNVGVLDGSATATNRPDNRKVSTGISIFDLYIWKEDGTEYEYDDITNKDDFVNAFLKQITKEQLISYINDVHGVKMGIIPEMDAFWKIDSNIGRIDEDASKPINQIATTKPIVSAMASTLVSIVDWLTNEESAITVAESEVRALSTCQNLSAFTTWAKAKGKTIDTLCKSIGELCAITIFDDEENIPKVADDTLYEYYQLLQYTVDTGRFGRYTTPTFDVTQKISVMLGYNEEISTVVLSAENSYTLPRPSDASTISDFFITSLESLRIADKSYTPSVISDDIFATFNSDPKVSSIKYRPSGTLEVEIRDGIEAFQLVPTENLTDEDYESIKHIVDYKLYNFKKVDDIDDAIEYFNALRNDINATKEGVVNAIKTSLKYSEIRQADDTVSHYWSLEAKGTPSLYDISIVDEYRTDESRVGTNEILIVDKTRKPYVMIPEDKQHKNDTRELIGVIPIITTAANALYAQKLISVADGDVLDYETIKNLMTLDKSQNPYTYLGKELKTFNVIEEGELSGTSVISRRLNNKHTVEDNDDDFFDSVAMEANGYFSPITLQADGGFDRENMKKIGLVVVKAYLDASEGNKISFQTVESFIGSLDRDAKNPNTGATTFIDTIVNEQSEYVNIFTNCFPTDAMKTEYRDKVDVIVLPHDGANVASMGFYEGMCEEDVDISESILKALDIVYDKVTDINERDLDIVVDAGVSNIAQFVKTVYGKKGFYDPASTDAAMWKCKKDNDVKMWKTVIMKYDNFCKNIRKDCMFIADGPRPYCLQGQKKIVRPSKPTNTIDANILPYTKYLTGINTSYGAGYCDWFQIADEFSGDYFWCPPSIKACGVYINTDLNFNYWDAPAGLNRGVIAALDVAFSPTNKQAGQIYTKSWNYAINYPADGIVLEGQRTLQTKPSALDRVNVRRLMLRLERATFKVLRYVVYEGNTAYMRQRVIDLLDPMFKQAKIGGGLYDYKIICDESNNTPHTIDNNELHISIGLKPTKTIEFIIVNFVLLPTGASWDEML